MVSPKMIAARCLRSPPHAVRHGPRGCAPGQGLRFPFPGGRGMPRTRLARGGWPQQFAQRDARLGRYEGDGPRDGVRYTRPHLHDDREGGGWTRSTATITGQVRTDGWMVASIKGPKIECNGITVPWYTPAPAGGKAEIAWLVALGMT